MVAEGGVTIDLQAFIENLKSYQQKKTKECFGVLPREI
jgi:hypothetical protein